MLKHILYDDQGLYPFFPLKFSLILICFLGTFLYNFPPSDLRSKSNRFISYKNKINNSSSLDATQFLTNLVKNIKHEHN